MNSLDLAYQKGVLMAKQSGLGAGLGLGAVGAGIGSLAAGEENRGRGALLGAGTVGGASLGSALGLALAKKHPVAGGLLGMVGGGMLGHAGAKAIAPARMEPTGWAPEAELKKQSQLISAYQEGVKLALHDAGLIKQAGATSALLEAGKRSQTALPSTLGMKLKALLGGAGNLAKNPNAQRAAGGAALGAGAGALTGDEDSNTLLRALVGAGIGGAGGGLAAPALKGAQGMIGAGGMGKALRGMGRESYSGLADEASAALAGLGAGG